jgi:phospholipid/cholesterol/gamma-HCH transport system substrate-binding protein
MEKKTTDTIKLGALVISGLSLLIILLYMIGKNRNLFGSNLIIKARFENVQGLKSGNNVRYGGIDIGTVENISFVNDSTLEVNMRIENNMRKIIRKNAIVSIGTDGLVGNKVINIISSPGESAKIKNHDLLPSKKAIDTDEMLRTLYKTNNNIASVAEQLKTSTKRLNNSTGLWKLLSDESLYVTIKKTTDNLRGSSEMIRKSSESINEIIQSTEKGEGSLGLLLRDTIIRGELSTGMKNIQQATAEIKKAGEDIRKISSNLNEAMISEKGLIPVLLKDSIQANHLKQTLLNLKDGTKEMNEIITAAQKSFLFRNYFKKLKRKE